MKPRNYILHTTRHALRITFFALAMLLIQTVPLHAASMTDYCIVPPYVQTNIPPNVFIILDNSYQMGNLAYTGSYDPTKTYPGLFHSDLWYRYTSNQFVPASTSYSTTAPYHGNLLNWATTSKHDLLESILVGGVSTSRQTNVNTLKASGNSWTQTYSGCDFIVNNGALTISDNTPNACHLIDTPPLQVASAGNNLLLAQIKETGKRKSSQEFLSYIFDDSRALGKNFLDFLIPPAYAANPCGGFHISMNSLAAFTEGSYSSDPIGLAGTNAGATYTWSITSGTLPSGLSLSPTTGTSTSISGTPAAGTSVSSPYSITVHVSGTDNCSDSKSYSLTVNVNPRPPFNGNVWICAGDTTQNCNSGSLSCTSDSQCSSNDCANGTCALKSGIVEMFYSQARFGLGDFNQVGQGSTINTAVPTSTGCIPATPKSSFLSAIENVTVIGSGASAVSTPLVNEEYETINYFATDTSNNCNPYNGAPPCTKSSILMITSGEGANTPTSGAEVYGTTSGTLPSACASLSYNLSKDSCYGYRTDLRTDNTNYPGTQNVSTYIVNAMGTATCGSVSCTTILSDAASKGGGIFYNVTDPTQLRAQLIQAFKDILKRAASGTAASVLASGQGQGANLLHALYYPRTPIVSNGNIFSTEIQWVGRLQNLWYYIDPLFSTSNASNIYDDYSGGSPDKHLNTSSSDRTVQTCFIASPDSVTIGSTAYQDVTIACLNSATGCSSSCTTPVLLEKIINLWEAGVSLWNTDPSNRIIKTTTDGSTLIDFSTGNASTLRTYLQAGSGEDQSIIRWVRGEDTVPGSGNFASNPVSGFTPDYRPRTVNISMDNGSTWLNTSAQVWKLGDIIDSTPRVSSWVQLNTYDSKYNDTSYTTYLNSSNYTNRGMVFAGGNDGMLHAFNLGTLTLKGSGSCTDIACLSGSNLGSEAWAFIPQNALPYLKYMADPSYCHVYSVDLSPYIFDASIGAYGSGDISGLSTKSTDSTVWRTILIGGMRFGGACKATTYTGADGVIVPTSGVGYSSYFALDVTDQSQPPVLLWEFSDPTLGFATSGPSIVRIGDTTKNGKWFVVFGSGPTGPIDTTNNQFLAHSDQPLKIFVRNLKDGSDAGTPTGSMPGNAFAGSMVNVTNDLNLDYQDDIVYIGYTRKDTTAGTWTQGGVGRLITGGSASPSTWAWSQVIDGIGPVTSAIVTLQNTNKGILWLYFGTGRYFYEQGSTVDDPSGQRAIYGVKEPCYCTSGATCTGRINTSCSSPTVTLSSLTDVTSIGNVPTETTANASSFKGWYINLNASGTPAGFYAERVITDPLATTGGNVLFTTFQPYTAQCSFGGKSYLWAMRYNTGGAPSAAQLQGMAILQTSTGSIQQENLSTVFTDAGGRKTAGVEGVPPTAQGLSILTSPPPVKRTIHMRER